MIQVLLQRFSQKDKRLGVSEKRQYDLPLSTDEGTVFLAMLIALMTFLALMALCSSFALGVMTSRWSDGLENQVTIEIPAETKDGSLRSADEIAALQSKVEGALNDMPLVRKVELLKTSDIEEMVEPWLGTSLLMEDIPLPGLVSVTLHNTEAANIKLLRDTLDAMHEDLTLDTHERWLADLMRLSGSLRFAALFITIIIGATTITAVAGAVRSRMAVHKADVELLHLMGATDIYIMRQFQRHALILAFKGAVIGTSVTLLALLVIGALSGDTGAALLPSFELQARHVAALLILPLALCAISAATARHTVLRVLTLMP